MIQILLGIALTVLTWAGNKAIPAVWNVHHDPCPPVLSLPNDLPDWKREIYREQCTPPGNVQPAPVPAAPTINTPIPFQGVAR